MSLFSKHFFKRSNLRAQRGFTLIELMVVTIIVLIITATLLFRQSSFSSTTLLRSLSYSVALSVRQAQVFGTSVRESSIGSTNFAPAYGLYFSAGSPSSYILFADLNNNAQYDSGEDTQVFRVSRGYSINNACAVISGVLTEKCTKEGDIDFLTILFKRPNPDAVFMTSRAGETYSQAHIQIRSAGGATRSITVTSTGQISVGTIGT